MQLLHGDNPGKSNLNRGSPKPTHTAVFYRPSSAPVLRLRPLRSAEQPCLITTSGQPDHIVVAFSKTKNKQKTKNSSSTTTLRVLPPGIYVDSPTPPRRHGTCYRHLSCSTAPSSRECRLLKTKPTATSSIPTG